MNAGTSVVLRGIKFRGAKITQRDEDGWVGTGKICFGRVQMDGDLRIGVYMLGNYPLKFNADCWAVEKVGKEIRMTRTQANTRERLPWADDLPPAEAVEYVIELVR